jgi:hypothetical protein
MVTARQSQYWKVAGCEGAVLQIVMLATVNRLLAGLVRDLRTSIITRFESGVCAPDQLYLAWSQTVSHDYVERGTYYSYDRDGRDYSHQRKRFRNVYVRGPSVARS